MRPEIPMTRTETPMTLKEISMTRKENPMRTLTIRRSFLAEAARLALWAAALCAAVILVASLSTEPSFGAGAEYHTGDSASSSAEPAGATTSTGSAGGSQSTSTSGPGETWSTGPAAAQPPGTLTVPAQGDLETRLEDARKRLQRDAQEVATLSAQLGTRALSEGLGAQGEALAGARDAALAAREGAVWTQNGAFVYRRNRRGVVGLRLDPASGRTGARVLEVSPGGPAQDAGVLPGDIIVAVNGAAISGSDTARQAIQRLMSVSPNSSVKLRVVRNGKPRQLELTARPFFVFAVAGPAGAGAMPPMPPAMPAPPGAPGQVGGPVIAPPFSGLPYFQEALSTETAGMELVALTPALGSYFGTDKGVLVLRAPTDDAFRLEDGDVIVSIGGREPRNGAHATRILSSYGPGEQLVLKVVRHRKPMSLTITLPGHAPR
jgi:PDZ domain